MPSGALKQKLRFRKINATDTPMRLDWLPKKEDYLQSTLPLELAVLSHLGLFTAIPKLDFLKTLVTFAIDWRINEIKLQEALLQSYLFLGFPRAINALSSVQSVWKNPPQSFESEISREIFQKRGEQLCEKIYGANYTKLLRHMTAIHPDLKRYMIEEGYGKILSREILNPLEREFAILPILIFMEVPKQLHSHLLGTLYLGASAQQIESLFQHLLGPLEEITLRSAQEIFRSLGKESRLV